MAAQPGAGAVGAGGAIGNGVRRGRRAPALRRPRQTRRRAADPASLAGHRQRQPHRRATGLALRRQRCARRAAVRGHGTRGLRGGGHAAAIAHSAGSLRPRHPLGSACFTRTLSCNPSFREPFFLNPVFSAAAAPVGDLL